MGLRINRVFVTAISVAVLFVFISGDVLSMDRRAYQHGVRFVKDQAQNIWAIWSSSPGNPPQGLKRLILKDGSKCNYFTHDIFYSPVVSENPQIQPNLLLSMPEAQEPADVAINQDGAIALTFEDGSETDTTRCDGVIEQRYKVFSDFPNDSPALERVRVNGGHSGHVAAVGNTFVIVYAEGWIEDDGVDDSSTANDIYVDTIASDGSYRWHMPVAIDKGWPRDWWPLIAGSARYALLVWQRLVKDSRYADMMIALYDPQTNSLVKPVSVLKEKLQYYHFDVQYLAKINRFLIVGNYLGNTDLSNTISAVSPKLFVYLLDETGNVVSYWDSNSKCSACGNYPNINLVREARPAVIEGEEYRVFYPVKPNGIVALKVDLNSVKMDDILVQEHFWFPLGTDGIKLDNNRILFMNLTPLGARLIEVTIAGQ